MTIMNNQKLLADQIKGLEAIINEMSDAQRLQELSKSFLADATALLSNLQSEQPQAYEQVERLALYLTSISNGIGHYFASAIHEKNEKAAENRELSNTLRWVHKCIAQSKAAEFWDADADRKEYALTEVADLVHAIMLREGHSIKNAAGKETITKSVVKEWIKATAPAYARQPGRRP